MLIKQVYDSSDHRHNVIILAAGYGSRVKPITDHIPKCLLSIGRQRLIDYLIQRCEMLHDRIYITTYWQKDVIKAYVQYRYGSTFYNIDFVEFDHYPENTGVSFRKALDRVDSDWPTIVMFSDIIVDEQIKWTGEDMVIVSDSTELDVCKQGYADGAFFDNTDQGNEDQFFGMVNISDTAYMKKLAGECHFTDYVEYLDKYNKSFKFKPYKVGNVFDFGSLEKVEYLLN